MVNRFGAVDLWSGSYFVSSATSTSVGAVMGALECPAVGSSVFSSPLGELITCADGTRQGGGIIHVSDMRVPVCVFVCVWEELRMTDTHWNNS